MTPRALFRSFAIAEVITWTLLIAGMLQKYAFDAGEWGVRVGGSIHGFVFIAYVVIVVVVAVNQRWHAGVSFAALASAVVPYASVPVERWIDRTGRLSGPWRRTIGDDLRDTRPADRLLRWVLSHLVLAIVLGVVGVAAVFAVLLTIGPPGR